MRTRYKRKCLAVLPLGLGLTAAGLYAWYRKEWTPLMNEPWLGCFLLAAIAVYLWGCALLAKAKGYSTAILLTAVFGLVFPFALLLVLRDKNR